MKLLFITQALDQDDPVLSAYHGWAAELAKHAEHVEAVCLKEGRHALPENVSVHSLGKEKGRAPSFLYAFRFLMLAWKLRGSYDTVFVHMNQEYLLIAGWLWKAMGKRMFLWRNHYAGSVQTDLAASFCEKVFCTSMHSYTAKYKKTVIMPVGVDAARFAPAFAASRQPRSILFFARMAPSKQPDLLIDALAALNARGADFTASFVGSPRTEDGAFYAHLRERVAAAGLSERVVFLPGVPNEKAVAVYAAYEISVNTSPSGMFDKTLFEAAAAGCLVLAASDDWKREAGEDAWYDGTPAGLTLALLETFKLTEREKGEQRSKLQALAERSNLTTLGVRLSEELRIA